MKGPLMSTGQPGSARKWLVIMDGTVLASGLHTVGVGHGNPKVTRGVRLAKAELGR